eukprot:CAMPEP_0205849134 /NCGR_PEP_ID=MMETSP1019-20131125/3070_1 /ASSEMBLY_ACC=CAM_ASM_000403 /TAXON_ID=46462 /ORGANISM="Anophryoides haemophila, Strain AH6" /LENGTH=66 /DNA_ID=CAMNT_0053168665 /DNA_START=577 /DNA_END=777 /DNA_ORIENTATION=-
MAAPLAALAQLGADFNAESIAQVRTLFEKLEADLVDARNDANDLEKKKELPLMLTLLMITVKSKLT